MPSTFQPMILKDEDYEADESGKNPDVYYAGFEDGSSLRVNIALIADYSLYTGRELNEDEYEALKASAKDASAKARALWILGKRNMSRREITERLMQKARAGRWRRLRPPGSSRSAPSTTRNTP